MRYKTPSPKTPSLEHNKALYEPRLIFGVPSTLFVMAFLFVIAAGVFVSFIASLVLFFVFIPPLILVHAKDEKGLIFLLDKVFRPCFYSAGAVSESGFMLVRKKGDIYTLVFIQH